ncbi:alpha/beta hydrolase [Rhizobium lusitanum]|uniref:Phospholipase/carboxylesterase n=1 Tax=Rhizobium lusitanum TaxID=293958 RepID=A0A1C3VJI2_9HYPH|nr:esterase [Rhizobium lusitanum]SCB27943.1 phospholipase/carboxylesterase [Rhizobium lusitanum]
MPEWPDFHFIAGRAEHSSSQLLLLHGSGSDEAALIPLADAIAPQRPYMAPRGAVEWEEGFAFFRRNPDRSLDHVDLDSQTDRLCRFITTAIERKLLAQPPVLLGFSNGAIMAASILQRRPGLASSAILMRPLSPAPDAEFPSMPALPILIISGENDQRREPGDAELVRQQFANAGADVSALVLPTDHGLHQDEADIIRDWLIRKGI